MQSRSSAGLIFHASPPQPLCPSPRGDGGKAGANRPRRGAPPWSARAARYAGSRGLERCAGAILVDRPGCINSAGCRDDSRPIAHVRLPDRGAPMSGCGSRIRRRRTRVHAKVFRRRDSGIPGDPSPFRSSRTLLQDRMADRDLDPLSPGMHGRETEEAARTGPYAAIRLTPSWLERPPEEARPQACRLPRDRGRPGPGPGDG